MLGSVRISETYVPRKVLEHYHDLSRTVSNKNWVDMDEQDIWHELCFCILSANVSYDLVKSVMAVAIKKNLFDYTWIITDKNSKSKIQMEFNKPQFLPLKKNGELRKYRYPMKRAEQITKAAKFLYCNNKTIKQLLLDSVSDDETRKFLMENISGLGIKEASHFLRNIGFSTSFAIIDVHVLAFLKKTSLINTQKKMTLTQKLYLKIERVLRNFAKFHRLTLSILDMALWHYMRNNLA